MKKSTSGFTVIELLVVIIVIAILAAITLVAYNGTQAHGRDAKRKTDIDNIVKALDLYYSDNNRYPVTSGSTTISAGWASSLDTSWTTLTTTLQSPNKEIDTMPTDPLNTPNTGRANTGVIYGSGNYSYALFVNASNYCGAAPGQMYLLVYRFEVLPKEKNSAGNCTSNELGDSYYANGASYYRVIHGT